MLGKNLLWVAKQHGHSVQTMLDVYAAWIEGSEEADLEAIRQAMQASPRARARIAAADGTRRRWLYGRDCARDTVSGKRNALTRLRPPGRERAALPRIWHWNPAKLR